MKKAEDIKTTDKVSPAFQTHFQLEDHKPNKNLDLRRIIEEEN